MELTIHWWHVVIILIVFPFIYGWLSEKISPTGDYGFDFMGCFIYVGCWFLALGIAIAKLF